MVILEVLDSFWLNKTIETELYATQLKWNTTGSVLAISGSKTIGSRLIWMVKFYSWVGRHLDTLEVPSSSDMGITALTWEAKSQRIALGVGASIYIADIQ